MFERLLSQVAKVIRQSMDMETISRRDGVLQRLDPRFVFIFLMSLVIVSVVLKNPLSMFLMVVLSLILAVLSKVPLGWYLKRVWLVVPLFSVIVLIPSMTNLVTRGEAIGPSLQVLGSTIYFTREGLAYAVTFTLRVGAAVSLSILMVSTIGWSRLMAALGQLRFPPSFVIILDMTYRYIHLLLDTVANMFMARKSRMVSRPSKQQIRENRRLFGHQSLQQIVQDERERVSGDDLPRIYGQAPHHVRPEVQPGRCRVLRGGDRICGPGAGFRSHRVFRGASQHLRLPWGLDLMTEPIVSLKHVSYRYPDGNTAIDGLDLDIMQGEAVAIVGPNGAGKSTLLQIIAGLIPVSEGQLSVTGRDIDRRSVDRPNDLEWLRRKLGIIFQDSDVALFNSTVWNDVVFGPLHMGLPVEEVKARGNRALERLGISHLRDRAPYRLSGGEKRKVSIASVLSIEPDILLFDEPTSDLDPRSRRLVVDLLKGMTAEGRTVIVATHDVNAVPDFATRIVVLNKHVLATGNVRTILSNESMLNDADLDVPEISRLFKVLASIGYMTEELPFSLDEAVEQIRKRSEKVHVHSATLDRPE